MKLLKVFKLKEIIYEENIGKKEKMLAPLKFTFYFLV